MAEERKESWAGVGPVIITQVPEESGRSSTDTVMRIAYGVVSAMVVSLVWIVGSAVDPVVKAWSVIIGLSVTAALLAGHALMEVARVRREIVVAEARMQSAVAAVAQSVAAQAQPAPAQRRPNRPRRRRRAAQRPGAEDPGQILSNEFQMYLQGRESRFNEP
ncbi:MAG: hypothetical protein HOU81_27115 [Hamadaea sp.]|uniref:hypothetical protein n=1 Tax=Hamadaea sp. TaxID=2024425 RepID=UPI0017B41AC0|nr:hypothetical protein [Hamadaea sp.]NUR74496.1 hypothetical protein [Hamadaea sp.]NUT21425.1 hypothetical protein [Hamadaea sp.]